MLPTHVSRRVSECLSPDYSDPVARHYIKTEAMPLLSSYRREVLAGIYFGRHERPVGFISQKLEAAALLRKTLRHAHTEISSYGQAKNVVSLAAARERRRAA